MDLIENIKKYFANKADINNTEKAPEGICPNCWGKQEWDGEYYKIMKGENNNPSAKRYASFVKEVVKKTGKIILSKDTYICATCGTK